MAINDNREAFNERSAAAFFRPEITTLPAYIAGKPSPDPSVIKVASNEMPFPTIPSVQEAMAEHLADMARYPDMMASGLAGDIARQLGVSVESVVVGNGSVALIERILADFTGPGTEVVMPWRSFESYPIAIQMAGARAVSVPLRSDGNCDLRAMLAAVTDRTRAVLVCTPNNPTSAALTHSELRFFLMQLPPHIPVLIDEAYGDFVRMEDPVRGLELVREFPNAISLRTFSKAYGLAALRCGYAIAAPEVVKLMRSSLTPFGVSALAQVAARAALAERAEVDRRVEIVVQERGNLVNALAALGWDGPKPQGNFVWFGCGEDSERFAQVCEQHKIVVRTFKGEGVRVTVAEPEAQLRLVRAYSAWKEGRGDF